MRTPLDAYYTPLWQTRALIRRVPITGRIFECCSGDGSIVRALADAGPPRPHITTNDIDPTQESNYHHDACCKCTWSDFWHSFDWTITNPPFNKAIDIIKPAYEHSRCGVIMLLRLSFLEPTEERGEWLVQNPPTHQIILPRWSYKQNGKTDSVTTAWMIWSKMNLIAKPIQIVGRDERGCEPTPPEAGVT